jgi:hypothetical protein
MNRKARACLRLLDEEYEVFKKAYKHYGYEDGADFLKECYQALLRSYKRKEQIGRPIQFRQVKFIDPP